MSKKKSEKTVAHANGSGSDHQTVHFKTSLLEEAHVDVDTRPGSVLRHVNYANLDAEKVLENFGTYGRYQMLVYFLANFGFFLFACETMIFSLIGETPDYSCVDSRLSTENYTLIDGDDDQCHIQNPATNQSFWCLEFDYGGERESYLTSDYDLVCEKANYAEHSMSTFMLGSMLFTPVLTQLADRYGRRITYLTTLWLAVIANIVCTFVRNYNIFLVFRFVSGIGTAGIGTIGFVVMLETVAPTFRTKTPFISTVVWVAGYCTVGVLHMIIKSWRWQFFVMSAPFVLTFSFYWLMPESIHWMITHNKHQGVHKYIKSSSRINKKQLNLNDCLSTEKEALQKAVASVEEAEAAATKDTKKRTFIDLMSHGPIAFQLVSHCLIMIVMNYTYWALSLSSPDLHEEKMVGYFLSGLVELPAAFAVFLLAFFGRRTVTAASLFAQALCMFAACFFPGKNSVAMSLVLLTKVFNSFVWMAEPLLVGEMSPTSMRNMFYGVVGFVGEIGSIIAPYSDRLKVIDERAPAMAVALSSILACGLALLSPETKDRRMPEDFEDFDAGPVYSHCFRPPTTVRVEQVLDDDEDNQHRPNRDHPEKPSPPPHNQ